LNESRVASTRQRILLVGNYEPDQQQSMQRYGQWLLGALRARGYTVVLIRPVPYFSRLAAGPARKDSAIKYLGYLDKFLMFPPQLRRAARQFDVVHICDHSSSMYLGDTSGKPTVITCHDLLAVRSALGEFSATVTGWSGRRLQAWILSGMKRARNVICVSTKTAEDLARLTGSASSDMRTAVIPNPLNWPYKPVAGLSAELREKFGLKSGESYFIHVGGNQWYKNRLGLVRIFRELAQLPEYSSTRLLMVGKPFPANLRALIASFGLSDRIVEVTGAVNEEVQAFYSNAIALIFPSLEEGFGWPIAEAQACGCPVATSNRAPMTEVAGNAAILIDPEDPASAALLIRDGLAGDAHERLRTAGFANVARFESSAVIAEYCDFYAAITAKPQSELATV
jgi:glycosyltransferase involved in cell wall biosynthesis